MNCTRRPAVFGLRKSDACARIVRRHGRWTRVLDTYRVAGTLFAFRGTKTCYSSELWGRSSAGRASRSQCEGQEFDPPHLHQQIQGPASERALTFWPFEGAGELLGNASTELACTTTAAKNEAVGALNPAAGGLLWCRQARQTPWRPSWRARGASADSTPRESGWDAGAAFGQKPPAMKVRYRLERSAACESSS